MGGGPAGHGLGGRDPAANFAFDVTPAELIAAIITDVGVLAPPFGDSIAATCERHGPASAAAARGGDEPSSPPTPGS
ncbi:MAG: hypothetical protein OES32_15795 [Acidobacteriota bacterium]|nr:hypothetical protein [Acidobacteriota bacterium]